MVINPTIRNSKTKMMLKMILQETLETTTVLLTNGRDTEILLNLANQQSQGNLTVTKLLTVTLLTTKNFKTKTTTKIKLLTTMVLLTNGKEKVTSHKLPQADALRKLKTKELTSTYKDNTNFTQLKWHLKYFQVTKLLMVTFLKTKNLKTKTTLKTKLQTTTASLTNGKDTVTLPKLHQLMTGTMILVLMTNKKQEHMLLHIEPTMDGLTLQASGTKTISCLVQLLLLLEIINLI